MATSLACLDSKRGCTNIEKDSVLYKYALGRLRVFTSPGAQMADLDDFVDPDEVYYQTTPPEPPSDLNEDSTGQGDEDTGYGTEEAGRSSTSHCNDSSSHRIENDNTEINKEENGEGSYSCTGTAHGLESEPRISTHSENSEAPRDVLKRSRNCNETVEPLRAAMSYGVHQSEPPIQTADTAAHTGASTNSNSSDLHLTHIVSNKKLKLHDGTSTTVPDSYSRDVPGFECTDLSKFPSLGDL